MNNKLTLIALLLVFGGVTFGQENQSEIFSAQDKTQDEAQDKTQDEKQTFAMGEHGSFGIIGSYILVTDFQKNTINTTYSWYGNVNIYGRVVNNFYIGVEASYVQWKTYVSDQNRIWSRVFFGNLAWFNFANISVF